MCEHRKRVAYPIQWHENEGGKTMEMIEQLSLAGLVPVIKVEDAADAVPPVSYTHLDVYKRQAWNTCGPHARR